MLSGTLISHHIDMLRQNLVEKGHSLVESFADNSEFGMAFYDPKQLNSIASSLAKKPDVVFAIITDTKDNILIHRGQKAWKTDKHNARTIIMSQKIMSGKQQTHNTIVNDKTHESVMHFTSTIYSSTFRNDNPELTLLSANVERKTVKTEIGKAHLGISLNAMELAIRSTQKTLTIMTLGIIIVGIIMASLLSMYVTKPIQNLLSATYKIAEGDLSSQVTPETNDEIGDLALAFNTMSTELQIIHNNLEEKVKERTEDLNCSVHQLKTLSAKIAKYISPQVYNSIFSGKKDVKLESYRRILTVFFSDIKGFTATTDSLESEALTKLLNEYLNEMSEIAVKNGGTIDKFIGDAIMIFFGDPETKGEKADALACVSMAIEMRNKMKYLQWKWDTQGVSQPLRVRIGINTGYCTVGNFGSEDRLDYTIIGGQVNIASRLESNAHADQILISHETYALIKDKIFCEPKGQVNVKGIAHTIQRIFEGIF